MDFSPRSLIKALEKAGFVFIRQSGSHKVYFKDGHGLISVPCHGDRDIPKGTYLAIIKLAGLK